MKKLFPLVIYHTFFILVIALLHSYLLQYYDFKALLKYEKNTFWFFVTFSSILLSFILLIYNYIPKARTMLLLGSFMIKFLAAATFFLFQTVNYETLLKSNAIFAASIFIVNYLVFTIWILFIYFRLNKTYID